MAQNRGTLQKLTRKDWHEHKELRYKKETNS